MHQYQSRFKKILLFHNFPLKKWLLPTSKWLDIFDCHHAHAVGKYFALLAKFERNPCFIKNALWILFRIVFKCVAGIFSVIHCIKKLTFKLSNVAEKLSDFSYPNFKNISKHWASNWVVVFTEFLFQLTPVASWQHLPFQECPFTQDCSPAVHLPMLAMPPHCLSFHL